VTEQPPIGEYGLLGDTRSATLVSRRGSIDWLCIPRFDADPVFGFLVDAKHGGRFELSIDGLVEERCYRPASAVLETRWRGSAGSAKVTEAMPVDVTHMRPQLAIELRPAETAAAWGRSQAVAAEQNANRRVGHAMAELEQFTLDPTFAPARVLTGHAHDQGAQLLGDRRPAPARAAAEGGPAATHELSMPAHQSGWGEEQTSGRQSAADRGQDQAIGGNQFWTADLAG